MRFILFCEGHTECKALPAFLKRWLDPKLSSPVGIKPVRFDPDTARAKCPYLADLLDQMLQMARDAGL